MKIAKAIFLALLLAVGLACGYSSHATTPAAAGTMPNIAELSPDDATAGGPAFQLTVTGTNFATDAQINWNGAAQPTTVMSGSTLTTMVPATAIATAETVQVTVTNPATPGGIYGGGTMAATSNMMTFVINQ